jgi:aspartate racemase
MKLVGIVGGVGPEASNAFCEMLIKYKKKKKDQDNIPFIHYCNPQIPDRTEAILGLGEDPTESIVEICLALQHMGADFLVIPCNTAHHFLNRIQDEIEVPIVDMTKVLVKKVLIDNPRIKRVGVLATTGSIKAGIFQNYFKSVGVETLLPEELDQETVVMEAIYGKQGIKAGKKKIPKILLTRAAQRLIDRGAEAIILGCTEIPLVLKSKDPKMTFYDPMELVAKEIINYHEIKKEDIITVKYIIKPSEDAATIPGNKGVVANS